MTIDWADAEKLGGDRDGFDRLWTPHRMAYVLKAKDGDSAHVERACPLCKSASDDDREHLIVHRGEHAYAVLNLYPYNPGHLMICPYRHVAWYTDLTREERDEIAELTQRAMTVLRGLTGTEGFNIGMNQGRLGGAGIHEHVHQHVVPRYMGDANFLPIIAQTKAVPEVLDDTWRRISEAWAA